MNLRAEGALASLTNRRRCPDRRGLADGSWHDRPGAGTGFSYTAPDGQTIRDAAVLARIRSLAIPPARTDVWICPVPNGHLQASGRDARGRKLFQYLDASGEPQSIDSADVNEYLRSISGQDFAAKDFRTWAGTVLAARWLMETGGGRPGGPSAVVTAARAVAEQLGNTPAVCRKPYINPLMLACYQDPTVLERWDASAKGRVRAGLSRVESRLIRFLATFPAG